MPQGSKTAAFRKQQDTVSQKFIGLPEIEKCILLIPRNSIHPGKIHKGGRRFGIGFEYLGKSSYCFRIFFLFGKSCPQIVQRDRILRIQVCLLPEDDFRFFIFFL